MSNTTSVQKYLSKQKLMHLIITKDNSVAFINQSGKAHISKVWLNYSTIFVDSTKQDYAMYNDCMILIAYKRNTGTGGMQKHVESCPKKPLIDRRDENKIASYFNPTKNKTNSISGKSKYALTNALT